MPSMTHWLHEQYDRMESCGKGDLVDLFEDVRTATFMPDPVAFAHAAQDAKILAEQYGEPLIRATADYYAAFGEMVWRGNLTKALDIATSTLISLENQPTDTSPLPFYMQEQLSIFWLCVDAKGYAAQIQEICQHLNQRTQPCDLDARLSILEASAFVAADAEYGETALRAIASALPDLEWPQPYQDVLLAEALGWAHRVDESLTHFSSGFSGLDSWPDPYAAAQARLNAAELLLDHQRLFEAESLLQEAHQVASTTQNRGLLGLIEGMLGILALRHDDYESAYEWLDQALISLNGLGWHHAEARYALAAATATQRIQPSSIDDAVELARQCVDRLRSHDLAPTLTELEMNLESLP